MYQFNTFFSSYTPVIALWSSQYLHNLPHHSTILALTPNQLPPGISLCFFFVFLFISHTCYSSLTHLKSEYSSTSFACYGSHTKSIAVSYFYSLTCFALYNLSINESFFFYITHLLLPSHQVNICIPFLLTNMLSPSHPVDNWIPSFLSISSQSYPMTPQPILEQLSYLSHPSPVTSLWFNF